MSLTAGAVTKEHKPLERVIQESNKFKLDLSILRKKSNAHTPAGLILSYAQKFKKDGNPEASFFFQEIFKQISDMEISEKIKIKSWRGRGGIDIWATPDKVIVEFAGKRDKDEKPNIQRKEYSKEDINRMIVCINQLKDEYENKIPSRYLGEKFYGGKWDLNVFSQRSEHMKFTHLLNILDYFNIIRYNRRGYTTILNPIKQIEEVKIKSKNA